MLTCRLLCLSFSSGLATFKISPAILEGRMRKVSKSTLTHDLLQSSPNLIETVIRGECTATSYTLYADIQIAVQSFCE